MADQPKPPTNAEIKEFLDGLRSYRATIPERQQQMLDVIVTTTLNMRARAQEETEVSAYWSAYNPPGAAGGPSLSILAETPETEELVTRVEKERSP